MLNRYDGKGLAKFIQIFGLCDETFVVNYTLHVPEGVDRQQCYTWLSLFNYSYWISGALIGGILGTTLAIKLPGLDFVMTALFIVLCLNQFLREQDHLSTISGFVITILCLVLVGKTYFLMATLVILVLEFALVDRARQKGGKRS